jgi:hypothetical protein
VRAVEALPMEEEPRRTSRVTLREPARRDPGFSYRVKLVVRTRAGHGDADNARCEACGRLLGRHGGEVRPRLARQAGVSKGLVTDGPANAVLLCGTPRELCFGACEAFDLGMEVRGFWLRRGTGAEPDPCYVPVKLFSPNGSWETVWLAESGEYRTEWPELV